ncbi:sugar nucleotide-binding protein [Gammaproteobacteria bacterium]|nr:sugar nucleotide-binding protein [Gammaproteobacteria bacterium]
MKKIYIAGSGGMLGDAFYHEFKNDYELKCTDLNDSEEWISELDFRDYKKYKNEVMNFAPDYLFHLGAHTDLEFCESNIEDTYSTNTLSVENAVLIANELDIPLLYISTAGIFDGSKDWFDDWDLPNPICHYARSKYAGELYVQGNAKRHLILRAGWMMGGGPKKDKKFIAKLMNQIKSGKKELHVVDDKLGTPTYTCDFAKNAKLLLEEEIWGLYNLVCGGLTGRFEVAQEVLKFFKLDNEITLTKVGSEFFKQEYFAPRPDSERLINAKLDIRDLNIMRDWKVCLEDYLNSSFSEYLK